jgi:hypothetical protein
MDNSKKTLIISAVIKISGWAILFYLDWRLGFAIYLIMVGDRIERDLHSEQNMTIMENILSSLRSLIKKDDVTEESEKIKNN